MFERIPLPNPTNYKMFDDVFDYLEEIRKRKSGEKAKAAELEENKRQFGITSALDREKLNELAKYHQGRLALQQHLAEMKAQEANSAKKLSPQERAEKMKLIEEGRASLDVQNKVNELHRLLKDNPNLTGIAPSLLKKIGFGGKELGKFTAGAGELQALIARLGGQRGGAQLVEWAKSIKPNEWNQVEANLGNLEGLTSANRSKFDTARNLYKTMYEEEYPLEFPENAGEGTVTLYKKGKKYSIPANMAEQALKEGFIHGG